MAITALSHIFYWDESDDRAYLQSSDLVSAYADLCRSDLLWNPDVAQPEQVHLAAGLIRWSACAVTSKHFPSYLDGDEAAALRALLFSSQWLAQFIKASCSLENEDIVSKIQRWHAVADAFFVLATRPDIDPNTRGGDELICLVLDLPEPALSKSVNYEEAHAFYRLQSACFGLIQVLMESVEAGTSTRQVVNGHTVDSGLLTKLFALVIPSRYETHAYEGNEERAGACIEARNKSLVRILYALSDGDIDGWINDPLNDLYMRQWISAIVQWVPATTFVPQVALSPSLFSRCQNLFSPPLQSLPGSDYWRTDDAQQVAMVVVWDQWRVEIPKAAEDGCEVDWNDLVTRVRKALDLIRSKNAVKVEGFIGGMLRRFRLCEPRIQDPHGLLPPIESALEEKMAEIARFKMSGGEVEDTEITPQSEAVTLAHTPP